MKAYTISSLVKLLSFFPPVIVRISFVLENKKAVPVHMCSYVSSLLHSIVPHTWLKQVDVSLDLIYINYRDVLV